ncbi:MAG: carbohydrate-binding family 9-like protein [Oscillospiraceae bacterium]|jgi:hypothetical protein|nr:carbohydrate-binding family 9-like protein [Oscillospiraceae bacterium]
MPDSERPVLQCPPITTIGGAPTPEQWQALPIHSLRNVMTGEPPRYATSIQTAYDPAAQLWFIRFDGEDPAWVSDYTSHDETIWTQDVFEVFYDDAGKLTEYKELEVSPRNVRFDANITYNNQTRKFRTDTSWDIDWDSVTIYDDKAKRLSSVWSIPFASLELKPAPGARMPINFYRIDRSAEHDGGAEFTAWSPTWSGTFHDPYQFGYIQFV